MTPSLSIPLQGGSYTYALDSGAGFGAETPFDAENIYKGVSFDISDQVRITATFPEVVSVDRVCLSAVTSVEGLTFDINGDADAGYTAAQGRPSRKRHYVLHTTTADSDTFVFTISGIGASKMDIRNFMLAKSFWFADYCYDVGARTEALAKFSSARSLSSDYQRRVSSNSYKDLSFSDLSIDNVLDLEHAVTRLARDGFVLYERNSSDPSIERNGFAVKARTSGYVEGEFIYRSTNLSIKEAFSEND